jgi:hypothetical protein
MSQIYSQRILNLKFYPYPEYMNFKRLLLTASVVIACASTLAAPVILKPTTPPVHVNEPCTFC